VTGITCNKEHIIMLIAAGLCC